jgi:hypothetical protein
MSTQAQLHDVQTHALDTSSAQQQLIAQYEEKIRSWEMQSRDTQHDWKLRW